jgi:hypothetical protein
MELEAEAEEDVIFQEALSQTNPLLGGQEITSSADDLLPDHRLDISHVESVHHHDQDSVAESERLEAFHRQEIHDTQGESDGDQMVVGYGSPESSEQTSGSTEFKQGELVGMSPRSSDPKPTDALLPSLAESEFGIAT